ncbi:MAG: hypothetical protein BIFFINMI_00275 [Phycisphaerae bacterium]|nr:hypothetical protein [Phycisphaerae bacterium]
MIAPVVPATTDHEMPAIIAAAASAGARDAGYFLMRRPLSAAAFRRPLPANSQMELFD